MFTHKDLIPIAYKWVLKRASCGVAFKELNTNCSNKEYPDVIGFSGWGRSVLIEVKVSRSDFLNDKKKAFRKDPHLGMGMYRFFMCPTGLIATHELPAGWGLIYVAGSGRATCVHNPYFKGPEGNIWANGFDKRNIVAEHGLMVSALRRLHIKGHIESIYDKQYIYNHKD
jgi:hypothetical protein